MLARTLGEEQHLQSLRALATNFIIDRAGHVRYARPGALDLGTLHAVIISLRREPAPILATADQLAPPVARRS